MKHEPLISVIVPCYNQAQYLDECLQSVLDQTYENWECIIVNDGSPDNTEDIAQKWIEKDDRFQYYKKENGGVASARNFGIQKAKGEWILPLDGDDKLGNLYLELASAKFSEKPDIIYCKAQFFGIVNDTFNPRPYTYSNLLLGNCFFVSILFRKEAWINTGGFDSNLIYGYEDWEFWIHILNEKSLVIQLDYIGFYYRRQKTSRDMVVLEDTAKLNTSYNYIFKKHLDKYLSSETNIILCLKESSKIDQLDQLVTKINKNSLTKLLYKVIKKLQ